MNTNLTNNNPQFDDLFEFSDQSEEDKHQARLLMYRFLSEIERKAGQKRGLKKRLAKELNTSGSYITQLFNGDKLVNLLTLARLQRILKIKFKITAYSEDEFGYHSSVNAPMAANVFVSHSFLNKELINGIQNELLEKEIQSTAMVQVIPESNPQLS